MAALVQFSTAESPQIAIAIEFWRALIEADRRAVPAEVLRSCVRWSLVDAVSNEVWSELMPQTLQLTKGGIDLPIEVADRCKTALTSPQSPKRSTFTACRAGARIRATHIAVPATARSSARPDGGLRQDRSRCVARGLRLQINTAVLLTACQLFGVFPGAAVRCGSG
jgi:hypothetical protein